MKIRDLGLPARYLGTGLISETDDEVSKNHALLANELLQRTEMENCRPVDTQMVPAISYQDRLIAPRLSAEEQYLHRSIVGFLRYLAIKTRPDFCVATSIPGSRMAEPSAFDMRTAKRVVRYLKGTRELAMKMKPGTNNQLVNL